VRRRPEGTANEALVSGQVGLGDLDSAFDALAGGGVVKLLVRPDL